MKPKIYAIVVLALVNIVIMKYNESKSKDRAGAWAMVKEGKSVTDSLLSKP